MGAAEGGRTGGNDSVGEPETESETESPDERHGTHRLRWLHRADPHGLRGHYGRRQGRSQIFDRLPLRGPDSRLTAVCGTMTRRPNEHKGSIKWQIITETLGVERGASDDEIKKAYRKLSRIPPRHRGP